MNILASSVYEPMLIEPNVGVKTFSSMSEMQFHILANIGALDIMTSLEGRAHEFVQNSQLTDQLKKFTEQIVAARVADALTP